MAYRLKTIRYHNSDRKILLQNENGPCPLLAAANALLLRGVINLPPACIRNGIASLNDVVNVLAEKAMSNPKVSKQQQQQQKQQQQQQQQHSGQEQIQQEQNEQQKQQNSSMNNNINSNVNSVTGSTDNYDHHFYFIDEVLNLLPTLQDGMDVNPKFTHGVTGYEYTSQLTAFDLLNLELVHGWLIDPQDKQLNEFIAAKTYNQLIEFVIHGKEAQTQLEQVQQQIISLQIKKRNQEQEQEQEREKEEQEQEKQEQEKQDQDQQQQQQHQEQQQEQQQQKEKKAQERQQQEQQEQEPHQQQEQREPKHQQEQHLEDDYQEGKYLKQEQQKQREEQEKRENDMRQQEQEQQKQQLSEQQQQQQQDKQQDQQQHAQPTKGKNDEWVPVGGNSSNNNANNENVSDLSASVTDNSTVASDGKASAHSTITNQNDIDTLKDSLHILQRKEIELSKVVLQGSLIDDFLNSSGHQLTHYGLSSLYEHLQGNQLCVFFRNNHFATLTKNSDDGLLYLLVTDLGYANVSTVVWEKLDGIDGNTDYVDCNFNKSSTLKSAEEELLGSAGPTLSPEQLLAQRGQAEADYQLALQLSKNGAGNTTNTTTNNNLDEEEGKLIAAATEASLREYNGFTNVASDDFNAQHQQQKQQVGPTVATGIPVKDAGVHPDLETRTPPGGMFGKPKVEIGLQGGTEKIPEDPDHILAMQLQAADIQAEDASLLLAHQLQEEENRRGQQQHLERQQQGQQQGQQQTQQQPLEKKDNCVIS